MAGVHGTREAIRTGHDPQDKSEPLARLNRVCPVRRRLRSCTSMRCWSIAVTTSACIARLRLG
jgi:hypothetical protein